MLLIKKYECKTLIIIKFISALSAKNLSICDYIIKEILNINEEDIW